MSHSRREAQLGAGTAAMMPAAVSAGFGDEFDPNKDPAVIAWKAYKAAFLAFGAEEEPRPVGTHEDSQWHRAETVWREAESALVHSEATTPLGVLCKLMLAKELVEPDPVDHLNLIVASLIRDLPAIFGESYPEPVWPPINA